MKLHSPDTLDRPTSQTSFQEVCQHWRAWANASFGGSPIQAAAGGDAAALTRWLGGVEDGDLAAAAREAVDVFASKELTTPAISAWQSAGLPTQSPEATWERLAQAGWTPRPLRPHPFENQDGPVYATFIAERWIGTLEEVEIKGGFQLLGEEVGYWGPDSMLASWIMTDALGALGRAVDGGKKTELKRVWKKASGRIQFLITDRELAFHDGEKWSRSALHNFMSISFSSSPGEAVQLLCKDNVLVQLRTPNARLLSLLLRSLAKNYWSGQLTSADHARMESADKWDSDDSIVAAIQLARSFKRAGYLDGAVKYFAKASGSARKDLAAEALVELGILWGAQSDRERQCHFYRRAIELGSTPNLPYALVNLGNIERIAGNVQAAVPLLIRATRLQQPEQRAKAFFLLACIYEDNLKDKVQARQAYEAAMRSGDPEYAPRAMFWYALFLRKAHEDQMAGDVMKQAVRSGHKEWAPRASLTLGQWFLKLKKLEPARWFLEHARASGHQQWAPAAKELLGKPPLVTY